ncbi:MAG TPA: 2Fe-2S iron-sulfur cluster-binding protein [Azospirillaceae bacterium]|nr:2Fe-2S iron-sulfur cluster-binding protein [Azospirillaceae bacterium]
MSRAVIRQWPLPLDVGKQTILDAALAAGVPYPHGCRTGECGACKSRLLAGEVDMRAYDRTALSDAERRDGLVLVCRAYPRSDVQVAWLGGERDESLPIQRMTAEVTNIENVTPDIRRIYAWPERPLRFAAGQFVRLGFANLPTRPYSMANRPDEHVLEFNVRLVPGGVASRYIAEKLMPGERIRLEGPFGLAHLRPDHDGPILAVAGGSGLAPIKSIIRTRLHAGSTRPIWLYVGARTEADIYDEPALLDLANRHPNLRIEVVLSSATGGRRRTGPLDGAIDAEIGRQAGLQCHIAGPPVMVNAVAARLADMGIPASSIHADAFHGLTETPLQRAWLPPQVTRLFRRAATGR